MVNRRCSRFRYPIAFVDRQKMLDILYGCLKDGTKVHLGKEVVSVKQFNKALRVLTRDGCCYDGDLVVGTDGIHSRVRSEMWKMADSLRPGLITLRDKSGQFYILYLWLAMTDGTLVGSQ